MPQAFLLRWVSFLGLLLSSWFLGSCSPFSQHRFLLREASSLRSFVPATGLLPGTPFSSAMASRCRCPIPRELLGLGRGEGCSGARSLRGFRFNVILRFSRGFSFRTLMNLLACAWRALRISGLFMTLLRSVLSLLCRGRLWLLFRESAFRHVGHLTCRKHFQSKCRHGHVPTGSKFHNVPFAHIKQSYSRDVSKALMMPLSSLQMMPGPLRWMQRQFLI